MEVGVAFVSGPFLAEGLLQKHRNETDEQQKLTITSASLRHEEAMRSLTLCCHRWAIWPTSTRVPARTVTGTPSASARVTCSSLHGSQHGTVIAPSGTFKITVYRAEPSQLRLPAFRTCPVLRCAHQRNTYPQTLMLICCSAKKSYRRSLSRALAYLHVRLSGVIIS